MSSVSGHCSYDSAFTIACEMPRRKKEDTSFGPRLTAIRKARGFTQVELAKAIGATQRSISYYENDDGVPPAFHEPAEVVSVWFTTAFPVRTGACVLRAVGSQ